jgi:hypothetical protein
VAAFGIGGNWLMTADDRVASTLAGIRGLTIRQPWASAIAFGDKRVENRSWPTAYRGLVAIHAGLSVDWDAAEKAWPAAGPSRRGPASPRTWPTPRPPAPPRKPPRTGASQWQPDWDGEVHTDEDRAAAELADCLTAGHQCVLGEVRVAS